METNSGVEKFALGIIVAVIVFLFLRRELGNHGAASDFGFGGGNGTTGGGGGASKGGCGCGSTAGSGTDSGQVIPIGGQSYNNPGSSYGGGSVTPITSKSMPAQVAAVGGGGTQWFAYASSPQPAAPRSNSVSAFGGGSGSVEIGNFASDNYYL